MVLDGKARFSTPFVSDAGVNPPEPCCEATVIGGPSVNVIAMFVAAADGVVLGAAPPHPVMPVVRRAETTNDKQDVRILDLDHRGIQRNGAGVHFQSQRRRWKPQVLSEEILSAN